MFCFDFRNHFAVSLAAAPPQLQIWNKIQKGQKGTHEKFLVRLVLWRNWKSRKVVLRGACNCNTNPLSAVWHFHLEWARLSRILEWGYFFLCPGLCIVCVYLFSISVNMCCVVTQLLIHLRYHQPIQSILPTWFSRGSFGKYYYVNVQLVLHLLNISTYSRKYELLVMQIDEVIEVLEMICST